GECMDLIVTATENPDSVTYLWDNGIINNNDTITVCPGTTTIYTLIATSPSGDIDTAQTTITVIPSLSINLGNDTTLCGGGILLDAGISNISYLWQDGSASQTLWANTSGTYWVDINNGYCSASDTLQLNVNGP